MKALLVVLSLILFTGLARAADLPTQPPPFEPGVPAAPTTGPDLPLPMMPPSLRRLLGDDDEDEAPAAKLGGCPKAKSCVVSHRLSTSVGRSAVKKVQDFLVNAKKIGADLAMIEITTPGGDYDSGHEIARAIENSPVPVVCVADSKVASMGFYVLQACDRRLMTDRSVLMAHQVAAGTPEPFLNSYSLEQKLGRLRAMDTGYAAHCARKMKITRDQFRARVQNGREWWLTADDAAKTGAVDKVLKQNPNEILADLRAGKRP